MASIFAKTAGKTQPSIFAQTPPIDFNAINVKPAPVTVTPDPRFAVANSTPQQTAPGATPTQDLLSVPDYVSGAISQLPARAVALAIGAKQPKIETFSEQAMDVTKGLPIPKPLATGLGVAAGLLGDPLNLVGGSGPKGLTGLSKLLVGAKTAEEAGQAMKLAGFADEFIKEGAPKFALLTDEKEIQKGLLYYEKLQNTTKSAQKADTSGPFEGEARKFIAEGKSAEDFAAAYYTPTSLDLTPGRTVLETLPTTGQYHGAGFLKPIIESGELRTSVSKLDAQGEKVVSLTGSRGVAGSYGTVFELKNPVKVTENPKAVSGDYYPGFEFRAKENIPLSNIKSVTISLNKGEGLDTQVMWNYTGKTPEYISARDLGKKFSDQGITVLYDDGLIMNSKSQLIDIYNKAKGGTPKGAIARPVDTPVASPAKSTFAGKQPTTQTPVPPKGGTPPTKEVASSPESYVAKMGKSMKDVWTKVVEYVQNTEVRVKQVQEKKGINVSDVSNPYQKMTLFHGRVGAKIEGGYAKAQEIADDLVSLVGRGRSSVAAGREELNTYLQALHAPERNAALGDGAAGMTTEDALKVTGSARAEIKAIAQKALDLNKQTLDMLHDTGVITDDLFNALRTKYKNHVPLQRVMEETDDIGSVLSGRGFDVKSTGIKTAVGSDKKVADVITNILNNYEQAVLRSEKNIYDNATLAFFRNNAEDLTDIGVIAKPKVVGKTFDGQMILERTTDPKILQMFENGKPVWIKFNDERVAIAYRGVGREKQGVLMNAVSTFGRFYSSLATRYNLDFPAPNKIRDLQEMMVYMASQKDVKLKGTLGALVGDPSSVKAVLDGLRGADTPGARLYHEMKSFGGTTGGLGLSTRKQTQMDVDAIFATASSRPRQAAQKLIEYVDNWNTVFEDSTRLSVYKAALARGLSKDRAAFLAKEATINFNRSGKGGPVINGLYMFANASIQGSAKMMIAMKNPKVAATVAATVGVSVAAVSEWNNRVDPDWRNNVTKWDRMNGLPILLPTEDGSTRYFVIPVSWGIKPILVMTNQAYDAFDGQDVTAGDAMGSVLSAILDGYNPVGGTDFASALTPTIADVPNEIRANQSWSGSKIRPDYDKNAPKDIQYFSSLRDTAQGRLSIKASEAARSLGIIVSPADINYVTDQYIGGAGRFVKKTADLGFGIATGDVPPADNWPFVSRFLRERTAEETGQGTAGETSKIEAILGDQSRERFQLKQEALDTYKTLKDLPSEVAAKRFDVLIQTNPELAQKVNDIAEEKALGLTYADSLIKSLGVANGERAKYIKSKFDELKTDKEKAALWDEMVTKKLITPDVSEQLASLYE